MLDVGHLTKCPHTGIDKILSAYSQTIYTNDDYTKIWTAGFNCVGQCGVNNTTNSIITKLTQIEYFKQNKLKINKIFINITGCACFFLTDDKKL